jgi:ABC-2 type transport system ATP-binding protein
MTDPAIAVDGVTHRYGDTTALDDLSMTVDRGCLFGLLGPNGAGKTTLMNLIATLQPVQSGHLRVLDRDVTEDEAGIRERIAVVFQSPHLDPTLTARENLQFHGGLYGLSGRQVTERSRRLLDRFGLMDRIDDRVQSFSGGLRRQLELVKGLLHEPELLVLDEPSSGLDLPARNKLWSDLQQLRDDEDLTIMMATHDMEEADICDTLGFIHEGRCVRQDQRETLKREMGDEILFLDVDEPSSFKDEFEAAFSRDIEQVDGRFLIQMSDSPEFIPEVVERFPGRIQSVTMRKPTLGDVFSKVTGTPLANHAYESTN